MCRGQHPPARRLLLRCELRCVHCHLTAQCDKARNLIVRQLRHFLFPHHPLLNERRKHFLLYLGSRFLPSIELGQDGRRAALFCGFASSRRKLADHASTGVRKGKSRLDNHLCQDARNAGSSDPSNCENNTGIISFIVNLPRKSFSATTSCWASGRPTGTTILPPALS